MDQNGYLWSSYSIHIPAKKEKQRKEHLPDFKDAF